MREDESIMRGTEKQVFSYNGYTCRILENDSIRIESYIDPYAHIKLVEGITLIIPDHIGIRPIWEIGAKAFAGNQSIKCLILPQFTTTIGSQAFADCTRLEMVFIPQRVRIIESDAFIGSTRLRYLTYPSGIKKPVVTIRESTSFRIIESASATDYVYSPVWGYGHVDKRETDNNALSITFDDGSKRCVSYSHHHRNGKLIYIDKPNLTNNFVVIDNENDGLDEAAKKVTDNYAVNEQVSNTAESDSIDNDQKVAKLDTPYMTEEGFALSDEQAKVYELLNTTDTNYLITGKAGTGKSVLLRYFVKNTKKKTAVVAFTGIAALNARGQTINSLFLINTKIQDPSSRSSVTNLDALRLEVLRHLDALIIDEISMVRSDMMDMIDAKLRFARGTQDKPFGGCQIIAFGDLYQLSPVDPGGKPSLFLTHTYKTIFFFGAPVIRDNPLKLIELVENQRQKKDQPFISALNDVRVGNVTESTLNVLNSRVGEPPENIPCITLVLTNVDAADINNKALAQLPGVLYQYKADYTEGFIDDIGKDNRLPAELNLTLKVGAMVMMIHNDRNHRWVNGTMAVVSALDNDSIEVEIDGTRYRVEPETWQKYEYHYDPETNKLESNEIGEFTQFPLKLAYAITVHKSQGQTYDNIRIDYGNAHSRFTGQTYVALSRCRTLSGVYLTHPITRQDIRTSSEVVSYIRKLRS